jgi:hypothetical protein
MGYVKAGVFITPEMTDIDTFQLSKIKGRGRYCMGCSQFINKGDNCYGRSFNKFCLRCGRILLVKAQQLYLELSKDMLSKIEVYDSNYEELNTENMANKI